MSEAIDDARRAQVLDGLQRHWDARTITPGEHERRVTLARRATTDADLLAAEHGLPMLPIGGVGGLGDGQRTHPSGGDGLTGSDVDPHVSPTDVAKDARDIDPERTTGLVKVPTQVAATVSALLPLLCVFAFFVLRTGWPVFLLIPISAILMYGPDGCSGSGDGRGAGDGR